MLAFLTWVAVICIIKEKTGECRFLRIAQGQDVMRLKENSRGIDYGNTGRCTY